MSEPIETDALIVGAGPVGLFQVFELGLLEVRAQVVDSLPHAGGQCLELYADKPIYDIPALPYCTGRELIERLQQQIAPFPTGFHLGQQVASVAVRGDGRFDVGTDADTRFVAKAIVIAGGIGSFQPRMLKVEGLDAQHGRQVLYAAPEPERMAGQRILIAGNGETAVAAAVGAVGAGAASVTVLHRRDDFEVPAALAGDWAALRASGKVALAFGQPRRAIDDGARLAALFVEGNDGIDRELGFDLLLVLLGWSPKLGPIAEWGLALERKQLVVDTERFETSTPGIHAVGDVNVYPGKKKLIVSGFHEATLAAFAIAERVHPDRIEPLQYTTTSTRLHKVLGVTGEAAPARAAKAEAPGGAAKPLP